MPQPPRKKAKKSHDTLCRERRERRRAESTSERERRLQQNRERYRILSYIHIRNESSQETETRLQECSESVRRRRNAKSPTSAMECETAPRPSRRAAIVASKKISNTVCNYNLKEDPDFNANASAPPKPPIKTEKAQKQTKRSTPPPLLPLPLEPAIEISLDMECEEELLSETQAKTLSNAQSRYNFMMMGLRELVQCNVKVIQTDPFGTVILNPSPMPFQTLPVKNTVILTSISSQKFRRISSDHHPDVIIALKALQEL